MTPEEVCDAAFGIETRDTPVPKSMLGIAGPWSMFFDGDRPSWWVEPTTEWYGFWPVMQWWSTEREGETDPRIEATLAEALARREVDEGHVIVQ